MRRKVKPSNGLRILSEGPAASQIGQSPQFLRRDWKVCKRLRHKYLCTVKDSGSRLEGFGALHVGFGLLARPLSGTPRPIGRCLRRRRSIGRVRDSRCR